MKRRTLLALAAASTGLCGTAAPLLGRESGHDRLPLRVMTYNIHAGIGSDGTFDLERLAGVLHAARADVIGLQEVDVHWSPRSEWRDEAGELSGMLGMEVFFAPIYDLEPPWPGAPRRRYGLAVLSRHPVLSAENHVISRLPTAGPDPVTRPMPGFPEVVVGVGGRSLHFWATHLDHRRDPALRQQQIGEMLELLGKVPAPTAQVLVGDLNAAPGAAELDPLLRTLDDTWAVASGPGGGATHPAGEPVTRLDYVLASPHLHITSAEVPAVTASDHRPVVTGLELPLPFRRRDADRWVREPGRG